MLSFLNSTVLFAAAAALIPLIIHLFSRRRVKVVEFSSLKHLKQMQKRQVRRLKIRQLLLLIVRMLIILAVVLAFARPTTQSGGIGAHAAVSAVVLVDNSVSMSRYVADGNLYDLAKRRTAELLETFGQSDQVALLPLAPGDERDWQQAAFTSAATAAERLEQLQTGAGRADFEAALKAASDLIGHSANLNRELYLVTDRQRNSLPESKLPEDTTIRVHLVELPLEENDNCGIVSVTFGGQLIQPGQEFQLKATVRNYSGEKRRDMIASLFLDDTRVAQTDFEISAQADTAVLFSRSVAGTGFHSGYVEISDDRYLTDNRYYFSFGIPERFNLLLIGNGEATQYVSLALVPNETLSRHWSVKRAAPAELSGVSFREYDVIMLLGAPELGATYQTRLESFVRGGGALFVSYDGEVDIDHFNRAYSPLTGVVYDEPVSAVFSRAGYYTLQSVDTRHPVFSVMSFPDNQPPEIKFFTLPKLHLTGDASTLMVFTGNRPGLVENTFGRGRVLCFTGPISPQYTDLPGGWFFVPFVTRVAQYLASDLDALDLRLYTGTNITRSLPLGGAVNYPVKLLTPDGGEFNIPPEEEQGALIIDARPSRLPGVYRITYLSREIDRYALNVEPSEGDLTVTDLDEYARSLGVEELRRLPADVSLAGAIAEYRFGRELWQLFLWFAVGLVILEILLARSTQAEE